MSDLEPEPLNPYAPPETPAGELKRSQPGIGRLGFVLSCTVIIGVVKLFHTINQGAVGPMAMVALILLVVLVGLRLMNIGRRVIACILIMVPVINFFVLELCLTLPPGYDQHRNLDPAGKIIRALFVGILVLMALTLTRSKLL